MTTSTLPKKRVKKRLRKKDLYRGLGRLEVNVDNVLATLCKRSFYDFILEFWECIVNVPFENNWHIKYLADELQKVKEYNYKYFV
jgi:hypothetical protein